MPWKRDLDAALSSLREMGFVQHYEARPLQIRATEVYSRKKKNAGDSLKPMKVCRTAERAGA